MRGLFLDETCRPYGARPFAGTVTQHFAALRAGLDYGVRCADWHG